MRRFQRSYLRLVATVGVIFALSVNCSRPEQLHRFGDCEELEAFLKDQYLNPRMESTGAQPGVSFLFGCSMDSSAEPMPAEQGDSTSAEESSGAGLSNGDSRVYTSTNVQEIGVDEADFVKNDGDHLFVLRRGHLMILDAWPADQTHVVADILVNTDPDNASSIGNPFTMFFDGQHLMVVGAAGRAWSPVREGPQSVPTSMGVVLSLYDIGDRGAPALLRQVRIDGSYLDARRVDDEVIIVTSSWLDWPFLDRSPFSADDNRAILAKHSLDELLPGLEDRNLGVDTAPRRSRACKCEDTYAPSETDGQSLVMVHVLSMQDPAAEISSTTVVSPWSQVYASEKSLYLAASEWRDGGFFNPATAQTRLHKFEAFRGGLAAKYVATGVIEGQIHNQFSIDEAGDDLRVVMTTDEQGLSSSLLVLTQEGDALVEAGRVDDIGRGEFVQSVRFIGERAYIVTYPEPWFLRSLPPAPPGDVWDPLWVVDLSDPHKPELRGELEVSGYSTYIHPLGEDHLLTIGADTDSNNVLRGLSLSIFDVSDPDRPDLTHRERFGDNLSWSDALTDHHAFTFFPERGVLGIPLQATQENGWDSLRLLSSGLEVYKVDVAAGFTHMGRIEQASMFPTGEIDAWTVTCIDVRRSVMIADDGGAFVYAVSTGGVSVAEITDGLPEVATVPFMSPSDPLCPDVQVPL